MKKILFLLIFISTITFSQKDKSTKMGLTTIDELKMTIYDKDSTAAAVVLYEHANVYLDEQHKYNTRTDFYYRIKILDKNSFDLANITINLYKKSKALNIKAKTYNLTEIGTMKTNSVTENNIFTNIDNENWSSKKFTMPNIKVGSVIEYSYSVISPYLGIDDWKFQSDIPKIKSEFDAAILGNYFYNVRIVGFLGLDKDEPSVKKKCIYIDGVGQGACAIYSYGMNDVPAFKEEDYMLSKKNYISYLSFDLQTYTGTDGVITKYTTTWKEADKKLKKIFFNNQTSKKSFFKNKLDISIIETENELEKAIKVYTFIQEHYSWNDQYWNTKDVKVKQAFNTKTGSAGEINLSLYNSLIAAKLNAELVILSTRNHGIPTKLFPVIFDFNYVIVKVTINDKTYYLDATNKFLPFGQLPIRTLNGQARIMDFTKESNWVTLKPKFKTSKNSASKLVLTEDGILSGNLMIRRNGYAAQHQREKINTLSEDSYLEDFEANNPDLEIEDYKLENENNLDKPLTEKFKININTSDGVTNKFRINPFFFGRYKKNPFKLKERNYPVDFGYSRKNTYYLSLKIPDNYKITQAPKNTAISLPNKGGVFTLKTTQKGNIINLYVRMNTHKKVYTANEYYVLKEFFNQVVSAENSYITIEKKQ